MLIDILKKNFEEANQVLLAFSQDLKHLEQIETASMLMVDAIQSGKKIISCGNGGSMCDAMHFAEELTGRFRENRKAIAAISISDSSHITCAANDFGFDFIFSRYLEAIGNEHDVLLAISTSGNSKNVLLAAQTAKQKGMKVVGLTGKDGGKLAELCDVELRVEHFGYADRIQEIHIKIIHSLIQLIEIQLENN